MFFFSCDNIIGERIQKSVIRSYQDGRVLLLWITMTIIGSNGGFSVHDFEVFREFLVGVFFIIPFL
jgi:hypothetical protein